MARIRRYPKSVGSTRAVIYYESEGKLLNEKRPELWHNKDDNLFLLAVPRPRRISESRRLAATTLFNLHVHERGSAGFPANVKPEARRADLFSAAEPSRPVANLPEPVWRALAQAWHLTGGRDGEAALGLARDLLHAALAIGHAPQFDIDHSAALGQDWLHLPIPRDRAAFLEVAAAGRQVATLLDHQQDATLLVRSLLGPTQRALAVVGSRREDVVRDGDLRVTINYYGGAQGGWRERPVRPADELPPELGETTGDLGLNEDVFLANVPARVWRHELGGYPVVKKWLGYRHVGRHSSQALTLAELDTLRGIVHRVAAPLVLRPRLDAVYEVALRDPFGRELLGESELEQ